MYLREGGVMRRLGETDLFEVLGYIALSSLAAIAVAIATLLWKGVFLGFGV